MATLRDLIEGRTTKTKQTGTLRDLVESRPKSRFSTKPTVEPVTRETVSVDLDDPNLAADSARNRAEFQAKTEANIQPTSEERRKDSLSKFTNFKLPSTVSELIAKPLTAVPRAIESFVGAPRDVSKGIQGATTAAVRKVPVIGKGVVSEQELQTARQESPVLGTFKENVPFVGGADLTTTDVAGAAAGLGFTINQYSQVNKIIDGLGTGSKLAKLLGGSKLATFGSKQAADLLVDIAVQAPEELTEAITNDKSIGEDVKEILNNRKWDVIINALIGGAIELPKVVNLLKKTDPNVAKQVVDNIPNAEIKATLETQLQQEAKSFAQPVVDTVDKPKTLRDLVDQTQAAKIETDPLLKDDTLKSTVDDINKPLKIEDEFTQTISVPKLPSAKKIKSLELANEGVLKSHSAGGNVDTAMAKVVKRTKKDKKTIKQISLDAHKQFVDMLTPFKTLERNITGSKKLVSAEDSFYKTAINSKGAPARAEELLRQRVEPIVKKFEKDGFTLKEFETYALVKHAKDVNAAGMKSGWSDAEIKAVIEKYGDTSLETYRKELMTFQNEQLKEMFDGDLLTKESLDALNNKWKNYMPLSRHIDDKKVEFLKGVDGSFNNVSDGLKVLKGSDKDVLSPLESIYQNVYKSQDAIAKNQVGVRLAELAKQDPDGSFIRKLADGEEVGRKNVITVKVEGKPVKFEVEPDVFKTFNNMDKESSAWLLKILQKPASLLRIGATTTLEFSARNPMKDIQDAFIKAPNGFNPFVDFGIGLMDTIKKGPWYSDFMKSSGGYSNLLSPDQATKHVKNVLKKGPVKGFVNIVNPVNWVKTVSAISNATESATKVGVFRRAVKAGESQAEAAFQARSIMDFARVGSSIKEANKVVAFLNSSIQGKSTMIRRIAEDPKKVLAKIGAATAVPTMGVAASNYFLANETQKKNIEDSPQWLKDTFWQIAIPGTDVVARLPKSFETAVISNGIERGLNKLLLDDKDAYNDYFKRSIKDLTDIPMMMTGLTGFVEAIANYSFFREGDIIPLREQGIKKEDQFDSRTSEVAKTVAGAIQFLTKGDSNFTSPRIIDNLIKSGTGGLGQTTLNALDYLLDKSGIANKPDKPKKDVTQLPLLKGLLVNSQQSGKSIGDLYDLRQELQEEKGSAKLGNERFTQQNILDFINDRAKIIGDLSKKLRIVNESLDLSSAEKKTRIDKLVKQRNNIAIETMKKVGK